MQCHDKSPSWLMSVPRRSDLLRRKVRQALRHVLYPIGGKLMPGRTLYYVNRFATMASSCHWAGSVSFAGDAPVGHAAGRVHHATRSGPRWWSMGEPLVSAVRNSMQSFGGSDPRTRGICGGKAAIVGCLARCPSTKDRSGFIPDAPEPRPRRGSMPSFGRSAWSLTKYAFSPAIACRTLRFNTEIQH